MKKLLTLFLLLLLPSAVFCYSTKEHSPGKYEVNNISYAHRLSGEKFQVYQDGIWTDITVKGVNIGMTRPGYWPGEAGISYEEYYRWFQMIGEMNANTIRVYTIHPPAFYKALYDYNKYHKNKLYLFHGVWADEEPLIKNLDAFHQETYAPFQEEIRRVIQILHGDAKIEARPGHASGTYEWDLSPYVLGYILGIEWLPEMVESTNALHSDKTSFEGRFFNTVEASPFEVFLAEMMDYTLTYEVSEYQNMRPVSFTNWVSTDLLAHPYEPMDSEDLVSVNPNHIVPIETAGYFASYHVYPYYPDFLNLDPKYTEYVDSSGKKNNYQGYLHDLIAAHDMPVLIAEFGIPASRGMTHKNIQGWNQGFIEEEEQGELISTLYRSILEERYLGGLIFSWQDEWFKRTWNTMDLDNEDRRAFWSNAQTNEQQFGILSFDRHKIRVDGNKSDWDSPEKKEFSLMENSVFKKVQMDYDERYLYLSIETESAMKDERFLILLNTRKDLGNTSHPNLPYTTEEGIEYLIDLQTEGESRILVDSYYDVHQYLYGHKLKFKPTKSTDGQKNLGIYHKIYLALNKGFTVPVTHELHPFEDYETGLLLEGNGNPASSSYNSLADYSISRKEGLLELRIPWLLLGFTDPSTKEVLGDFYLNGITARENIDEISFTVIHEKSGVFHTASPLTGTQILSKDMFTYTWNEWTEPVIKERLKKSYQNIQKTFQSIR